MFTNFSKSMFGKAVLASAVLAGALCFAGAPKAQADERDRVVRYDNYRVHEAVERHGFYSLRADYWRFERRAAFARGDRDRFDRGRFDRDRYDRR